MKVINTPNALKGNQFLYEHPELRAQDLMWAFENDEVNGVICNMGGDDSYRVLPLVDWAIIKKHPKVFMGYSDIASWTTAFAIAGVRSYYGPNLLTPIAQPVSLDEYTKRSIERFLFSNDVIGEVEPCEQFTNIEWNDKIKPRKIKWTKNTGYEVIQGKGKVQGRLFGGCTGPLRQIMGTKFFPKPEFFEGCIIALEVGSPYGSALAGLHDLRAFAAAGVFDKAAGFYLTQENDYERSLVLKVINEEVHRNDLPIIVNGDFGHRTPMSILPIGAMCEIDCDEAKFRILEPTVS